jgi:hypothetical protein
VKLLAVAKQDSSITHCFVTPGGTVPQSSAAEEPLAVAARSRERLARALNGIGVAAGPGALRLYADLDALGAPIVVIGPLGVESADRLSLALEREPASVEVGDLPCP